MRVYFPNLPVIGSGKHKQAVVYRHIYSSHDLEFGAGEQFVYCFDVSAKGVFHGDNSIVEHARRNAFKNAVKCCTRHGDQTCIPVTRRLFAVGAMFTLEPDNAVVFCLKFLAPFNNHLVH